MKFIEESEIVEVKSPSKRYGEKAKEIIQNKGKFGLVKEWKKDKRSIANARVFKSVINKDKHKSFTGGKFICKIADEGDNIAAYVKFNDE